MGHAMIVGALPALGSEGSRISLVADELVPAHETATSASHVLRYHRLTSSRLAHETGSDCERINAISRMVLWLGRSLGSCWIRGRINSFPSSGSGITPLALGWHMAFLRYCQSSPQRW